MKKILIFIICFVVIGSLAYFYYQDVNQVYEFTVTKDILYKTDNLTELKMDFYKPINSKRSCSPVVLIHGRTTNPKFKDTDHFTHWGELVAQYGCPAITFNWRSYTTNDDVLDLLTFIMNDEDLKIKSINIIGFSRGVEMPIKQAILDSQIEINSIVAFYGVMSMDILESKKDLPPILIIEAGLDEIFLPGCNDEFIRLVKNEGHTISKIVYKTGDHGFDFDREDSESNEIIESALKFINKHN